MKKDLLKVLVLAVFGLFVVIMIYPILHELGHLSASILLHIDVFEVRILPPQSVLCNLGEAETSDIIIIAFGGVTFPFLISLLLPHKRFWSWYFRLLLQGVTLLSLLISSVSIIFTVNAQDDMVQLLNYWNKGKYILLFILLNSAMLTSLLIYRDKPLKQIYRHFNIM